VTVCWFWRRDTSVKSAAALGKRNRPCFYQGIRDSSVTIVIRLRTGDPWFESQRRKDINLFSILFGPFLEPTKPSVRWIARFFPESTTAWVWYWPLTSIQRRGLEWVEICLCSPIHLHGVDRDNFSSLSYTLLWPPRSPSPKSTLIFRRSCPSLRIAGFSHRAGGYFVLTISSNLQ
jgi:hypothetical protein